MSVFVRLGVFAAAAVVVVVVVEVLLYVHRNCRLIRNGSPRRPTAPELWGVYIYFLKRKGKKIGGAEGWEG